MTNKNVLLLDAGYVPLGVISSRKAVVMVLMDFAEIIHEGEGECRSPTISVPWPEVIRLTRMVKVPGRARIPLNKNNVVLRDRGLCAYRRSNADRCLTKATTMDHVRPRSRNGKHRWENVVASCTNCNSDKADKLLSELGWENENEAYLPHGTIWLGLGYSKQPSWEPYLATA
jgi:5-methylcytosine-specific restriction endonuclease McrA